MGRDDITLILRDRMSKQVLNRDRYHIFSSIRTNYHCLSTAQKHIADYVLSNSQEVFYLSISELAYKCKVSETTILRFLKKINYDSYQVFRVEMAQVNANSTQNYAVSEITDTDTPAEITGKIISSTVTAVTDIANILPEKTITACVEAILNAGMVYVFGVGSSAYIAGDLYHKISRLGLRTCSEKNDQMISLLSTHIREEDTVILVSHSGESRPILESARMARENGAFVCAITSYARSSLSGLAQCVLLSSSSETKYRPDAMLSRIIQMVIVDIISINCIIQMGETAIEAIKKSQMAVARHKR